MIYCKGWEKNTFLLARVEFGERSTFFAQNLSPSFSQFIRKGGEVVMFKGKSV